MHPWPKSRDVGRFGDMCRGTSLRVGLDDDGDVSIVICGDDGFPDVEFCTVGHGGGKSPKTYEALIALMVAMEEDNENDPARMARSYSA